ncbi:unnamed protein product [Urochloa decumbens]|uniref:Uncharacterized protein n=1 Tax=Urochloa decumbens TaxID=240449 RepID=A0ABC8XNP9_9POAL
MKKFDKQAAVDEKLQRLEMLLIKIHSTIEVSQKHRVQSTWLLRWQEKLKEGASQGDEVLASFKQRAEEGERNGSQQAVRTSGTLSFSRIMLSGTTRYLRNVTKVLFSNNGDAEKLNSTLERLEDLAADTGRFIRLVEREIWAEREKRSAKRQRREYYEYYVPYSGQLPLEEHAPKQWKKSSLFDAHWEALHRSMHRDTTLVVNEDATTNHKGESLPEPSENKVPMVEKRRGDIFKASEEVSETIEMVGSSEVGIQLSSQCMNEKEMENEMLEERLAAVPVKIREAIEKTLSSKKHLSGHSMNENENTDKEMLEKRLGIALHKISKTIDMADSQDIKELVSLAQWIGILREAMHGGNTVLGTIKNNTGKEIADFGQEADELFWYLHSMERLAYDVVYIGKLIVLVTQISSLHINLAD